MAELVQAASPKEVEEVLAFRLAVFGDAVDEGGTDVHDRDPTTLHCVVRDSHGQILATGRLVAPIDKDEDGNLIEGNPIIGPIVVADERRGRGLGRTILSFLEEEALAAYGRNGVVRVEAKVSRSLALGADTVGYSITEDGGPAQGATARVFRDIVRDAIDDSRG